MAENPEDLKVEKQIALGYFIAFLEGKKTLGWAVSMISSKLYGQPLLDLMAELEDDQGEANRYQELQTELEIRGFLTIAEG